MTPELVCEFELELGAVEVDLTLPELEPVGALLGMEREASGAELEGRKGLELVGAEVAERETGGRVSVSEYGGRGGGEMGRAREEKGWGGVRAGMVAWQRRERRSR
jgi:hypothetical protein